MKSPVVITFSNQKGGVGKTTSALQTGFFLGLFDYRVLLLDIDPQANATSLFFETGYPDPENTVFAILKDPENFDPQKVILESKWNKLSILPSSLQLSELEPLLTGSIDGFFRLQEGLEVVKHNYEFIVIDCPPSLGMLTINALMVSDFVVIPLQAAKFSMDGIRTMLRTIETLNTKFKTGIQILGALMTMYNGRATISRTMFEEMKKYLKIFSTKISSSVIVEESFLMKEPLYVYAPGAKVTLEYKNFVMELVDEIQKR